MAPDVRLGIDVGGTNTDAVALDREDRLLAEAKVPTSPDVTRGITAALDAVLARLERPAERGGAFARVIGSNLADDGVHRVVGAARVDGQPADPARLDPVRELPRRAGMLDEVAGFVRLDRATLGRPVGRVEAVIPGVDDENVAALNADARLLFPALEVLRAVDLVVADAHLLEVHHAGGTDQKADGQLTNAARVGDEVVRRVQVGADVQRRGDLHAADALEGDTLDPLDGRAVVPSEPRRVGVPVLRQVEHVQRHGLARHAASDGISGTMLGWSCLSASTPVG
jgi:hypothetical protein